MLPLDDLGIPPRRAFVSLATFDTVPAAPDDFDLTKRPACW